MSTGSPQGPVKNCFFVWCTSWMQALLAFWARYLGGLYRASLEAQMVKNLPAMWETWVQSLGWEDSLEKGMATHSSILAGRIPWTEEPGRLQSTGSQRVGHDWATFTFISQVESLKVGALDVVSKPFHLREKLKVGSSLPIAGWYGGYVSACPFWCRFFSLFT